MTGKTHQIIGITGALAFYLLSADPVYSPATLGAVLVVSHVAALLPDLDSPSAQIWNQIPFGQVLGEVADEFLSHRNFSHSLLGFALFTWLFYALLKHFPDYWGIDRVSALGAFIIAYGSHLLADMVTVEGIPIFFPYQRSFGIPPRPFEGLRIITGKWFENLIVFPLVNVFLLTLLWTHWDLIRIIIFK